MDVNASARGNGKGDVILLRADDKLAQLLSARLQLSDVLFLQPPPPSQPASELYLESSFDHLSLALIENHRSKPDPPPHEKRKTKPDDIFFFLVFLNVFSPRGVEALRRWGVEALRRCLSKLYAWKKLYYFRKNNHILPPPKKKRL